MTVYREICGLFSIRVTSWIDLWLELIPKCKESKHVNPLLLQTKAKYLQGPVYFTHPVLAFFFCS